MVMARSRLNRWISVGAFSNSSDASCDSGSVVPASDGTRTCSSAANSACCVIGVRTTMRILLAGRFLERAHADAGHRQPHGAIELRGLHAQLLRLARIDAQLEIGARDVQRILDVARARRGLDHFLDPVATAAR